MNKKNIGQTGLLIAISGPSGAGKGTIIKELLADEKLNAVLSVSMTSRKKRKDETEGREYFFVTKKEFEKKIKDNEMLEWVTYNNNYYGTWKTNIQSLINVKKNVILEIDYRGVQMIKKIFKNRLLTIFIKPPSLDELKLRLEKRSTEGKKAIDARMKIAEIELKFESEYDFSIVNQNIKKTINEIKKIINYSKTRSLS